MKLGDNGMDWICAYRLFVSASGCAHRVYRLQDQPVEQLELIDDTGLITSPSSRSPLSLIGVLYILSVTPSTPHTPNF